MKTNIALIGFMGTGKTAVGKVLAQKLGKEFVELDCLIEQKTGKTIPDIFSQDGEIAFRELEIEVTKEVAKRQNLVIACGGGLVLNKINIDRLKEKGVIVLLTASPSVILKRTLHDGGTRPLLKTPERLTRIRELLAFRKPFYERAADIKVDTSRLSTESVAKEIMEKL
ncbi:MAG: shikimate kinase [Chloroflexi bacterium]|nr:shikimate kinase [Chloroflexota bacterium]